MFSADFVCIASTDELWSNVHLYTVHEKEFTRSELISLISAFGSGNFVIAALIDKLNKIIMADNRQLLYDVHDRRDAARNHDFAVAPSKS